MKPRIAVEARWTEQNPTRAERIHGFAPLSHSEQPTRYVNANRYGVRHRYVSHKGTMPLKLWDQSLGINTVYAPPQARCMDVCRVSKMSDSVVGILSTIDMVQDVQAPSATSPRSPVLWTDM